MNIWLIRVGETLPIDKGTQRLFRMGLIAEEFRKLDVNVLWWASSFDHNKKEFRATCETEIEVRSNYNIHLLHGCGYAKNITAGRLRHYMIEKKQFLKSAEKKEKPDIILVAMPNIDLAHAAVKFGKMHNIPVFVDVRDLWPDLYEEYFPKLKKIVHFAILPFKWQLSYTLKNATGILATSDKFLDWALNYANRDKGALDNYYYVSYPETDIPLEKEDYDYWYTKGLSDRDTICCFFGQFGHAVNIETVLYAAKELKDKAPHIKFVICGVGEKLDTYKQIVGNDSNVIFPGWVNRKQICALGKLSSVGLLAYRKSKNFEWSMPNKFCEYLALGLCLMIEPKGMMADLALKKQIGYRYLDAHDLAEQLFRLSNHKSEIQEIKYRSRKLYEESFKADVVYSKLANDLLRSIKGIKNEI